MKKRSLSLRGSKSIIKILTILMAMSVLLSLTGCSSNSTRDGGAITTADVDSYVTTTAQDEISIEHTEEIMSTQTDDTIDVIDDSTIVDRAGNLVKIPDELNTIISTAPSVSEILVGLGLADKIIAADMYSGDIAGMNSSICNLDFSALNIEALVEMSPDLIIVSEMTNAGTADSYQLLANAGANVVYIPTSNSIEDIKQDILFLAEYTQTLETGNILVERITATVNEISDITSGIENKKSVYFEVSAAPYLYSFGNGTFLNEIIEICGGRNIYESESRWLSNSEESVLAANPDVILTNLSYEGYDYNEIKTRIGWENINAVKNNAVYLVDANASSRPSQNVVAALNEISKLLYPELFS